MHAILQLVASCQHPELIEPVLLALEPFEIPMYEPTARPWAPRPQFKYCAKVGGVRHVTARRVVGSSPVMPELECRL